MSGAMVASNIDADLHCINCDYNLRGLHEDGRCPECGHPIAATTRQLKDEGEMRWLALVGRSAILIGANVLLPLFPPFNAILTAVGTWHLATPRAGATTHRRAARLLRAVALLTCLLQFLLLTAAIGGMNERDLAALAVATLAAWASAAALTFICISRIARRVRDRPGVIQARILAILAPLMLTVPALAISLQDGFHDSFFPIFVSCALITACWAGAFLIGFGIMLKRRAAPPSTSTGRFQQLLHPL
jgi:hypothetical protein